MRLAYILIATLIGSLIATPIDLQHDENSVGYHHAYLFYVHLRNPRAKK